MHELSEKMSFTLEQELGKSGVAPEEVQILPSGEVNPKGKTGFLVDEESRKMIMDAFAGKKTDLVVDYEHQSLSGAEAPAAGWIKELMDRGEEGVWGRVQWTNRAMEYIKKREYRYISPVVLIRKSDGRAVELLGAALTNLPAIDGMTPVANAARPTPGDSDGAEEGYKEIYREVLKLIGLPEDAGLEEVRARVDAFAGAQADYVPKREYEALVKALAAREAEVLINKALSEGRLTPSLLPWARDYAAADPEGFREFLGRACPVVPLGGLDGFSKTVIDQSQRDVNLLLGIGEELFIRCGQTG